MRYSPAQMKTPAQTTMSAPAGAAPDTVALDVSRIHGITLDLDDTLWPVGPTIVRAEQALQDWLATHAPATAALCQDRAVLRAARQAVNAEHPEWAHDFSALRRAQIQRLLRQAGDDEALAPAAFEAFFAQRQRVDLFDDVLPALAWLSARWPVVALSNGNADVHRVGIGRFFSGSVSARDVGVGKPDARIFRAGAAVLGCAPEQVLHVGDDAALDVAGALAAGLQAAWVQRLAVCAGSDGEALPEAHWAGPDLAALCRALA